MLVREFEDRHQRATLWSLERAAAYRKRLTPSRVLVPAAHDLIPYTRAGLKSRGSGQGEEIEEWATVGSAQ
jgi:hypothetical protein